MRWCEDDTAQAYDCAAEGIPSCGWSADIDAYDCDTAGSAEPTGTYPIACE